ncbi:hypothetical protein [Microbulbifer agarilyticus]|uniref:hypothetical protein n=1 Tax=Microbulbifer agarilyticus TaxID=260552 RepID=UPI001CD1FC79|nr:hypothetical protein [Microbulbifer agarilyticus]MCA0894955.1 hypothetical protein [Microbulbifer agarilyticus]
MQKQQRMFGLFCGATVLGLGAALATVGIIGWALAAVGVGLCLLNVASLIVPAFKRARAVPARLPYLASSAPAGEGAR